MATEMGVIVSINVSPGGVPKRPVQSARVTPAGLEGDGQRDRRHHGGPDRALCLYALERIEALQREAHPVTPGSLGENLTIGGLNWDVVRPGARLITGRVQIEITTYASPCGTIRSSFANHDSSRISEHEHSGWSRVYARVIGEGDLRVGDQLTLVTDAPTL